MWLRHGQERAGSDLNSGDEAEVKFVEESVIQSAAATASGGCPMRAKIRQGSCGQTNEKTGKGMWSKGMKKIAGTPDSLPHSLAHHSPAHHFPRVRLRIRDAASLCHAALHLVPWDAPLPVRIPPEEVSAPR